MGKRDRSKPLSKLWSESEDRKNFSKDIHQNINSSHVLVVKGIVDNFYSLYNIITLTLFEFAFQ